MILCTCSLKVSRHKMLNLNGRHGGITKSYGLESLFTRRIKIKILYQYASDEAAIPAKSISKWKPFTLGSFERLRNANIR